MFSRQRVDSPRIHDRSQYLICMLREGGNCLSAALKQSSPTDREPFVLALGHLACPELPAYGVGSYLSVSPSASAKFFRKMPLALKGPIGQVPYISACEQY
jgi:hypothetical protein